MEHWLENFNHSTDLMNWLENFNQLAVLYDFIIMQRTTATTQDIDKPKLKMISISTKEIEEYS